MKTITTLALAIAVLVTSLPAHAASRPDRIVVSYVKPKSAEHLPIFERLKVLRFLERFQDFLKPFELPRNLLFKTEGCDGEANAWYEDGAVTICYEYIDEIWKIVPEQTTDWGVAPIDALIGPIFDTMLHEFGHALFEMLKLPVFGREEDAADQVAAYMTLQLGKVEARRLIGGTANAYLAEVKAASTPPTLQQFANEHGTPAQRLFNLLCIAYGADPKVFGDITARGYLPKERAEGCEQEYKQAAFAFETLITPHVNARLARRVMKRSWLPEVTVKVYRRGTPRPAPASVTAPQ